MDKIYNVFILISDSNELIGAFTSFKALSLFENRINKVYSKRGWDIIESGGYKKEWIMKDYCLNNFDIIMHD